MEFSCITLTTDYGNTDAYAPVLCAQIRRLLPQIAVMEVSHNIRKYDIRQASFVLRSAFRYFPPASLHLLDVTSTRQAAPDHLFFAFEGHYFLLPDNGIASLITLGEPVEFFRVPEGGSVVGGSFRMLTEVLPALSSLYRADSPAQALGEPAGDVYLHLSVTPFVSDNLLQGQVLYVDGYQNLITNIGSDLFRRFLGPGEEWQLMLKVNNQMSDVINRLCNSVDEVEPGDVACYFGFDNLLHLAIRCGPAASLLGMKTDDRLYIEKWKAPTT